MSEDISSDMLSVIQQMARDLGGTPTSETILGALHELEVQIVTGGGLTDPRVTGTGTIDLGGLTTTLTPPPSGVLNPLPNTAAANTYAQPQVIAVEDPPGGSGTAPQLAIYHDQSDPGHVADCSLILGAQSDGGPDIPVLKIRGIWTNASDGNETGEVQFYVVGAAAFTGNGVLRISSSKLGFFGTAPSGKPTITGSRGGNVALAALLTALAGLGLLTDSTT